MQHIRLLALWRGHTIFFALLVLAGALISASWIGQALLSSRIFAEVIGSGPSGSWRADAFAPLIAGLAAVLLLRPLLGLGRQLLAQRIMTIVKSDLRARTLRGFVRRGALEPAAGRSGRDHAVIVDGVEHLDAYLSGYLPQIAVTVLVVLSLGGVMIALDPVAGAAALLAALLVPLLPRLWDRALARRGADHWEAYQELHAEFVDSMQGMTTLVAFGADRRREAQLVQASARLLRRTLGQLRLSLLESGLSAFALAAVPAIVLGVLLVRRDSSAFELFALVLLSIEIVRPLRELAAQWHAGYLGTFSGPPILALLAEERSAAAARPVPAAGDPGARDAPPAGLFGVHVRHPRTDPEAEPAGLSVAELAVPPGLTAIVGPSGAGKSTLAAVLAGLLVPQEGRIELRGAPCAPDELLERVSLVAQDPVLFGGTVAEEIALGAPVGTTGARAEGLARELLRICGGDSGLTPGTPVGEHGALLSGGQRQRVAIARALAQERELLALDEATSALDPAGEAELVAALRAADPRRPIVAITHRLDVARGAERVVVVEAGRIAQTGEPAGLLAVDGPFARLAAAESGVA
ncbi:MAG: ATP-binding cassette domain-containing protein [Pseudoclavibacter sp.]|nr:ATP-binding cassette domain-containing protein [Pseudoclavibacter sp.]